jgi:hypothetical protein
MGDGDSIYTPKTDRWQQDRIHISEAESQKSSINIGGRTLDTIIKDKLHIAPLDDRNDPPTLEDMLPELTDAELENEVKALEAELQMQLSTRKLGDITTFPTGRDYKPIKARIVPNTFDKALDGETAIYLMQGAGQGVSVSLETLKDIVKWAEGK